MKLNITRRGFLGALASLCLFPSLCPAANIVVGTGNDTSYLILQSTNLGVRTYEIHYTYNAAVPRDALFLLSSAAASDPALGYSLVNYGTESAPNYFLDSISLNGVPESGSFAPPWTWWTHWVAGGWGSEAPTYDFDPGPVAFGTWKVGYGISSRTIEPGSSDLLFLSDGSVAPAFSPIPEPASLVLLASGSFLIFRRRRA